MKTVYFLKDHCRHKKGDTVTFLVDNHAESLIANGVAADMIDTAESLIANGVAADMIDTAESLIANGVATDMIDTAEKPKKTVKN